MRLVLFVSTLLVASLGSSFAQQRSGIALSLVDPAVRPQDDFWRFANGKWLAATDIPADRPSWDTFSELREKTQSQLRALIEGIPPRAGGEQRKLGDFYASFMDEKAVEKAGLAALKPELERIRLTLDRSALPALFAHLSARWVRVPFWLDIGPDERDATTYVAHLRQGRLGLPDRDYYLKDDPHFRTVRTAYRAHVAKLLSMAGEPASDRDVDGILELETALARVQWTRVQNRDPIKTYNKRTIVELPALISSSDWRTFLGASGAPADLATLVVVQPSYIDGLGSVMRDTPMSAWRAWLAYNLLSAYASYLPSAFVDEDFAFEQRTLRGVPEMQPRWKRGVAAVDRSLPFALGRLYVERHFSPASKAHAERMIAHFLDTYRQSIETLEWMGPQTRHEALQKLAAIRPKIGYPEKGRTYQELDVRSSDLVGNVIRARRHEYDFWIAKIGRPVDREEWFTAPQVVNAFYNPNQNEIVFPAGILQPPFFDADYEDAANYGGIGVVIGHEISHAFDDQGSRFDGVGNLRDWWTAEDRGRFESKTRGLIAQYDAFSPLPGYQVNGQLTLGENVADNSGLAVAVKAYRRSLGGKPAPTLDGYSGDQRLFLAFAQIWKDKVRDAARIERLKIDPHSPGQFRANGALRNQTAFDEAFGLKQGDGMYLPPADRISIW